MKVTVSLAARIKTTLVAFAAVAFCVLGYGDRISPPSESMVTLLAQLSMAAVQLSRSADIARCPLTVGATISRAGYAAVA
jgi:hypothetical protein